MSLVEYAHALNVYWWTVPIAIAIVAFIASVVISTRDRAFQKYMLMLGGGSFFVGICGYFFTASFTSMWTADVVSFVIGLVGLCFIVVAIDFNSRKRASSILVNTFAILGIILIVMAIIFKLLGLKTGAIA